MTDSTSHAPRAASALDRILPWALGALTFLPLLVWRAKIDRFIWFGDDLDLVDQIARLGFGPWVFRPFAESWAPLFKSAWGAGLFLFQGSYLGMLALIWLSNALTVALLASTLRHCGFRWAAIAPGLAVLGLSVANLETLCWSVQLSQAMANVFFAAALRLHFTRAETEPRFRWRVHGPILACIAASALCYSRGVLTGIVLAPLALVSAADTSSVPWRQRLSVALAYAAPAIAIAGVIVLTAQGNQSRLLAHGTQGWGEMFRFAVWYFCLNPFHVLLTTGSGSPTSLIFSDDPFHLLPAATWGPRTTLLLGAAKALVVLSALRASRGRQRAVLALLLLFDLGNAALLGLGRYHTQLAATVSSRYQYCALLATMPFAVFWLDRGWALLPRRVVAAAGPALTAVLVAILVRNWGPTLDRWIDWRGDAPRAVLLSETVLPGAETPGAPFIPVERARELRRRYHLH